MPCPCGLICWPAGPWVVSGAGPEIRGTCGVNRHLTKSVPLIVAIHTQREPPPDVSQTVVCNPCLKSAESGHVPVLRLCSPLRSSDLWRDPAYTAEDRRIGADQHHRRCSPDQYVPPVGQEISDVHPYHGRFAVRTREPHPGCC